MTAEFKLVFAVALCAQHGSCNDPDAWSRCRPLAVFEKEEVAADYQQYYCREWHLPDCDRQPAIEAVPYVVPHKKYDDDGFGAYEQLDMLRAW